MRYRSATTALLCMTVTLLWSVGTAPAQTPAPAPARAHRASAAARPPAAPVIQVMKGILFPSANVVFAAQSGDPAKIKRAPDQSLATDPLMGTYGGWEAVGNAGVALSEAARLLEIPRACSTGTPAPIASATWKKGLSELRAAGQAATQAADAKNQDQVLDASDKITNACSTCHVKYREKTPRCTE